MGDEPGTVSAAEWVDAFFFDAAGNRLPNAEGADHGEIVEHMPDGSARSTLFVTGNRSAVKPSDLA